MTNKEAIRTLEANYPDACFEQLREAVDAAIEALKAQDAADDMVSKQVVINTVRTIILGFFSDEDGVMTDTEKTLLSVNKAICNGVRELPSAQPEVLACGEGELSAQPEIIRCKDCKHHGTNGCRLNCAVFCCTMPDDGFCSFGKRREDG